MSNAPQAHSVAEVIQVLGLQLPSRSPVRDQTSASNQDAYEPVSEADFRRVCRDGERTAHLERLAGYLIGEGLSQRAASKALLAWNANNNPPLLDVSDRHIEATS